MIKRQRLPSVFILHPLHQVTLGVGRITILKTKTACQHITKSPVHFTTTDLALLSSPAVRELLTLVYSNKTSQRNFTVDWIEQSLTSQQTHYTS